MRKNKFLILAAAAALVISGCSRAYGLAIKNPLKTIADTTTTVYTLDGTITGGTNVYGEESSIEQDDVNWKVCGNTTMNPWRIGGKSLSNVDRRIYSTSAIDGDVAKIEIVFGAASNITVNSLSVNVYSTTELASSGGTGDVASFTPTFVANNTVTINKTDTNSWDDCFYDITLNVSVSGNTNRFVEFKSAVFSTAESGEDTPTPLTNPNPRYNDSNKTVSWTSDPHATKYQIKVDTGSYEDIETETYDASGLTVGAQHTVYINAVGDGVDYSSTEGSVTFTPTAPFASKNYVLCTSTTDLEAGASYLVTNGTTGTVKTMSTTQSSNNRPEADITITDSKAVTAQNTLTVTLGGSSGAWTFSTENYAGTDGYLASATGSSNNYLRVIEGSDNCTISFDEDAAIITFSSSSGGKNILRYNSTNKWFACYGENNTQADVYLWREYTTKTPSSLEVTGTPNKLTGYYDSDTFDSTGITAYQVTYSDASTKVVPASDIVWPPLTANMGTIKGSYTERGTTIYTPEYNVSVAADTIYLEVSGTMVTSYYTTDSQWNKGNLSVQMKYTSGKSSTDVTSSSTFTYYTDSEMTNAVASPAALGEGEDQTIYVKATYSEYSNASGYAQVVSVIVEPGTLQNDPLTADEAISKGLKLSNGGTTENNYYISGVVRSVDENSLNNVDKKYATFFLVDNNASVDFKAYRIQAEEGCDNYGDLKAGAEVLIKCKIYKYNSTTIENDPDGKIQSISYTAPELTSITLNHTELNLEVNEPASLTAEPSPAGAELENATWISSTPAVATVSQEGSVLAIAPGTTTITVFDDSNANGEVDNEEIYANCSVRVYRPVHALNASFEADLTDTASVTAGFSITAASAKKGSGYYQDPTSGTLSFTVERTTPLFSIEPESIRFTARLGAGSNQDPISNKVQVCLVDNNGDEISETITDVAALASTTIQDYTVSIPYAENAYGVKLMHAKESGYNIRYYSFSFSSSCADSFATIHGNETNNGVSCEVDNVSMKFGVKVSVSMWNKIESELGTIDDYGVMMFRRKATGSDYASSRTPVKDAYHDGRTVSIFNNNSGDISDPVDGKYSFTAYVNVNDPAKYNVIVCAAPFLVVDGDYYFLDELQYSVNTLATYYQSNPGSSLSDEALAVLAG